MKQAFDAIVERASERVYLFHNLVRCGCPHIFFRNLIWHNHACTFLFSCFPVSCNAPEYLKSRLLIAERRITRIAQLQVSSKEDVLNAANAVCLRLITDVEYNSEHSH